MCLGILAFALLVIPVTEAIAAVPNMTCKAERGVAGPEGRAQEVTDIFRVTDGRLYHGWNGRAEYFYNHIVEVEFRRYASGHMLVVLNDELTRGYVVIAGTYDWRVAYISCRRT